VIVTGPARSSKNCHFHEQWNPLRTFARANGLTIERRFFDPEGDHENPVRPLSLLQRSKLAKLFLALQSSKVRTVLVDNRCRLDDDELVRVFLCKAFMEIGVKVLETGTGTDLTDEGALDAIAGAAIPRQLTTAKKLVASWKRMVTRLQKGSKVGKKPFGVSGVEAEALARVRELAHVLPKSQWRRRGKTVQKRRSYRQIAAQLNHEGVPSRTGMPWSCSTVYGILKRRKRT
jgi:hypothetical protein